MRLIWLAWTYMWRVAMNLITIFVVLYVFSRCSEHIETIVIALASLLYCTILGVWRSLLLAMHQTLKPMARAVDHIRIAAYPDSNTMSDLRIAYGEADGAEMHIYAKVWLNSVGLGIVALISGYQLFVSLY